MDISQIDNKQTRVQSESNSADIHSMTGWKYSASNAYSLVDKLLALRTQITQEYAVRDIVVLGMGGSALGTRIYADLYKQELQQLGVRFRVVDTTEPSSVMALLADLDVARCLIFVSSKSGGTIEPLCLGQVFFKHVSEKLGSPQAAAAHFVAITDESTLLSKLAETQIWRAIITSAQNVGGRFSVLTAYGLAPLVLAGINPKYLIDAAIKSQLDCNADTPCPARMLADSLYQNMIDGRDKLVIAHDSTTESFARWLEQLIAESLGKGGKGLIPLPMPFERANKLLAKTPPDIQSISLARLSEKDAGESLVRWMYAIEKLAEYLQLNPYDQPNVEAVKQATRLVLAKENLSEGQVENQSTDDYLKSLLADPRIRSIDKLPELITPKSFIVLKSWAPMTKENIASLENLASRFEEFYQRPVVIAEGPHYLHASGQLYKGGPNTGVYVLLSQETDADLEIPGANYSLKQLYRAAFGGDTEVMLSIGRPLVRL